MLRHHGMVSVCLPRSFGMWHLMPAKSCTVIQMQTTIIMLQGSVTAISLCRHGACQLGAELQTPLQSLQALQLVCMHERCLLHALWPRPAQVCLCRLEHCHLPRSDPTAQQYTSVATVPEHQYQLPGEDWLELAASHLGERP